MPVPSDYSGTLQAHAGGNAGLKFDLDGNWGSSTWGGTSASAATVNQTIGSASWTQSDSLPMDVSDGYYYTFHLVGDYSWGDRSYVVMKTKPLAKTPPPLLSCMSAT